MRRPTGQVKMTDTNQLPTADIVVEPIQASTTQPTVVPATSQNIIKQHKALSILSQIYNWQPMGFRYVATLPIEQGYNPLFGLQISPYSLPFRFFKGVPSADFDTGGGTGAVSLRVSAYNQFRSWGWPIGFDFAKSTGDLDSPAGQNFVEYGDMPDITWHALHHAAWSGGLQFGVRVVSNVTTQGKIAVSRFNDARVVSYNQDPISQRTLFSGSLGNLTTALKNSALVLDLSRSNDIMLNAPYLDMRPCVRQLDYYNAAAIFMGSHPSSWFFFYILGALDKSAGSQELILDFWIKAGPDFQLHGVVPPTTAMISGEGSDGSTSTQIFFDKDGTIRPYIYGKTGSNLKTVTDDGLIYDIDYA